MPRPVSLPRKLILDAMKAEFLPRLQDAGFTQIKGGFETLRALRSAYPLGVFRRFRSERMECVDLWFLKYHHNAQFFIVIGTVPPEGVAYEYQHASGRIPQAHCTASDADDKHELTDSRFFRRPFRFGFLRPKTEEEARAVALRAAACIPEAERWFATGVVGPHMRPVVRIPTHPKATQTA